MVATGLGVPNSPSFPGSELVEGYEDVATDPRVFEGKNVLILGRGKSSPTCRSLASGLNRNQELDFESNSRQVFCFKGR